MKTRKTTRFYEQLTLWQTRSSADFFGLQIFYTHNFDMRDGDT